MYGYVYLTTNLVNGKKYIGQHAHSTFDESYKGSGVVFLKALKKYGTENFTTEILCECKDKEELNQKEIFYIAFYDAVNDDNYYNMSFGGGRNIANLNAVYNASTDDATYVPDSYVKEYLAEGYILGTRPRTEEQIEHYKKAKENKIPVTDGEIVFYISKEDLPEYESLGFWHGRNKPTRPNQRDEKRKWMHKGNESFMVKPENFEYYLDKGFEFGRAKFSKFERIAPAHNKGKKAIIENGKLTYK